MSRLDFGSDASRGRGPSGPLNFLADHALRHSEAIAHYDGIFRFFESHPHADVVLLEGSSVCGVVHDRAIWSLTERILAAIHLTQRLGFEQGINGSLIDRLAFTTALVTPQSIFLSV
jgi:hypothetical protein